MSKVRPLLLAVVMVCLAPAAALPSGPGAAPTIQQLVGEDRHYAIDFLFFTRIAEGTLRFTAAERQGLFRAELVGRTLGVASWLAGDRTQSYSSLMEQAPDGSLRTVEHVSRIIKRRWGRLHDRTRRYRYDYRQGKLFDEKITAGSSYRAAEHDIPHGGQPVDMLTALYNLRTGVYGALVRGARMQIPTYSGGKFTTIDVQVLTSEQQSGQKFFPAHGALVRVRIDPAVFDTGSGSLYVWFDDDGVPGRGIVEDLIGMGDVLGYLDKEGL